MFALRFVVAGKLAHFRRFYTNSSSLTYPIPPPPTLRGLLGAAVGLGPEYADRFAKLRFGIRPAAPWRFLMQTANFLKIKRGEANYAGGEHTQIPLQLVAPRRLEDRVRYEVLVVGEGALDLLKALKNPRYPLSLGPAYALAHVEAAEAIEGDVAEGASGPVLGAFLREGLAGLKASGGLRLLEDRYPLRLAADRTPLAVGDLIVEATGQPVELDYRAPVFLAGGHAWALVG